MAKKETFEAEGEVTEVLPNALFRVEVTKPDEDHPELEGEIVLGHLSGKMRHYYIKVMPGDRVKMEMTPYDLQKGRIVYRHK